MTYESSVYNKMKKYLILSIAVIFGLAIYFAGVTDLRTPPKKHPGQNEIPARIISINPAVTEIIFELGCQDKLVAISDYCNYPSQTAGIEKIGGVTSQNFERISFLKPDLIIVQGESKHLTDFCEKRNIEWVSINLRYIDEIYDGIKQLGEILGSAEKAENLCDKISAQFKDIENRVSSAKKKKVFFSFFRTPGSLAGITTVGPKTCLSELITLAGGINIFDDVSQDYTVISKESLLKRQPDIIIEPYAVFRDNKKDTAQAIKDWSKLGALDAVKNNRICFIDPDLVLKPGPRIGQATLKLAMLLHPELFSE